MTARDSAAARIVQQLRRIHDGDAWHGPSITEALAGISAEQATMRPIAGAHTIHELAHHLAAWTGEVLRRLEGRAPQMPDEGDFPTEAGPISGTEWQRLKTLLAERHAALAEAIATFDDARLSEEMGAVRDAPLGTGVTYYAMLHGLIQHDAYHAGQIMLLRKALD